MGSCGLNWGSMGRSFIMGHLGESSKFPEKWI